LFLSAIAIVSADTGPHNAAEVIFRVTYNNSSVGDNFDARLLACGEAGCKEDNFALCTNEVCKFSYYRIERVPNEMKLLVEINGENFTSNIINFSSAEPVLFYDININDTNNVAVNPVPAPESSSLSSWATFFIALALTIVIEMIILILFLRKWKIKAKQWKKPAIALIIADIISVPLVWAIFFFLLVTLIAISLPLSVFFAILVAEAFAVVFEAYFIYGLNKKIINLKRAFILSIAMNLASFILGGGYFNYFVKQAVEK